MVTIYFSANDGNGYAISVWDDSGSISLSGYDSNVDGKKDAHSINASSNTVWGLYVRSTETVIVGKGKKQTTEERATYVLVAEYAEMSLDIWLDLLGFRVEQFAAP